MEDVVVKDVPWEGQGVLFQPPKLLIIGPPDKRGGMRPGNAHDPHDVGKKVWGLLRKFMGVDGCEG